jgi:hypothetical protein
VDRCGATCTYDMVVGALWPDRRAGASQKSMVRTLLSDIASTFEGLGVPGVVERDGKGGMRVITGLLDCDYYRMLAGETSEVNAFRGEYKRDASRNLGIGESSSISITLEAEKLGSDCTYSGNNQIKIGSVSISVDRDGDPVVSSGKYAYDEVNP